MSSDPSLPLQSSLPSGSHATLSNVLAEPEPQPSPEPVHQLPAVLYRDQKEFRNKVKRMKRNWMKWGGTDAASSSSSSSSCSSSACPPLPSSSSSSSSPSSHLQLIADFDRTLSAFRCKRSLAAHQAGTVLMKQSSSTNYPVDEWEKKLGKQSASSHQILEECVDHVAHHDTPATGASDIATAPTPTTPSAASTFHADISSLNSHYFSLEIDPSLTESQRAAHMQDWWNKAHELIGNALKGVPHVRAKIRETILRCREEGRCELRVGADKLFHYLEQQNIPCLIFSAGLKETIIQLMKVEGIMLERGQESSESSEKNGSSNSSNSSTAATASASAVSSSSSSSSSAAVPQKHSPTNTIHVIANETIFAPEDDPVHQGALIGFGEDIITSSNKNYSHVLLREPKFHAANLQRRNVILVGDNLGDAAMAQGMDDIQCLIKIGYLHERVPERKEQFFKAFDVLLLHDSSLDFVIDLIRDICEGKQEEE